MNSETRDTMEPAGTAEPTSTADLAYGRTNGGAMPTETGMDGQGSSHPPLMPQERSQAYAERWHNVQAEFVDEPQQAVKDADGLVAEVIQQLATNFADQRKGLEDQWSSGSEVSTEDLRLALMQYRSFFQRLLAA